MYLHSLSESSVDLCSKIKGCLGRDLMNNSLHDVKVKEGWKVMYNEFFTHLNPKILMRLQNII